MKITLSEFVRRQTKDSPYSYSELPDAQLVSLALENFSRARPGYRDGVVLVPVDPQGFFSATTCLEPGQKLEGCFKARAPGEMPRKGLRPLGDREKTPARYVELVLYRWDVLDEDDGRSSDADWEIISINASISPGPEPIPLDALLYNYFHVPGSQDGGTSMPGVSQEKFVELLRESFFYWRDKI